MQAIFKQPQQGWLSGWAIRRRRLPVFGQPENFARRRKSGQWLPLVTMIAQQHGNTQATLFNLNLLLLLDFNTRNKWWN